MSKLSSIIKLAQLNNKPTLVHRILDASPDNWLIIENYPQAFNGEKVNHDFYAELSLYYPFLNFVGMPLGQEFHLQPSDYLRGISLNRTGLSSLNEISRSLINDRNLNYLDLSENPLPASESLDMLGNLCAARASSLRYLDLEGINFSKGPIKTIKRLINPNAVLRHLDLHECHLQSEHAEYLTAAILAKKTPFDTFILSNNSDIASSELVHLFRALTARGEIKRVDFRGCQPFLAHHEDLILDLVSNTPSLVHCKLPLKTPSLIDIKVQAHIHAHRSCQTAALAVPERLGFFTPVNRVIESDTTCSPKATF